MKAVRINEYGGLEALSYEDVEKPEPGEGEARVKVEAVGVNFIDIYLRLGLYDRSRPFTLGHEGGGIVEAVGPNVTEVKPGDRVVYAMVPGSYSEYAIVPAWKLVQVPAEVDMQQATAVILQGLTAHYLTHSTYPLKDGDTALVHAAGGGTGQLIVQMAKLLGARIIGTASTEEKIALAHEAGADDVINYTQVEFDLKVKRLTNDAGVDVVYDSVGKDTFDRSLNCLRPRGCLALFGQASGPVGSFNPQILNSKGSLFLTRPTLGHYIADRTELEQRAKDIFTWMSEEKLKVRIDKTYPLAEAAEAHAYLEGRQSKGKILLIP